MTYPSKRRSLGETKEEPLPILFKYLPKEGRILDAGCGRGGMLIYLLKKGYTIKGCEFSCRNIALINQYNPDIAVDHEDILRFSYSDQSFDAMLSYGVMEHFAGGPAPALREAARVLKRGGILFISVPHSDSLARYCKLIRSNRILRKVLGKGRIDAKKPNGKDYVELEFSRTELRTHLKEAGFAEIESMPILTKHTVATLSPWFRSSSYPENQNYGTLLDPPLSRLGSCFYRLMHAIDPWLLGHFQFSVARRL